MRPPSLALYVKRHLRRLLGEKSYMALRAVLVNCLVPRLVRDNGNLQYFMAGNGFRTRILILLTWGQHREAKNLRSSSCDRVPHFVDYEVEFYKDGRRITREKYNRIPFRGVLEIDTKTLLPELSKDEKVTSGVVMARIVGLRDKDGMEIALRPSWQIGHGNTFGETVWINELNGSISTTHVRLACLRPWPFREKLSWLEDMRGWVAWRWFGYGQTPLDLTAGSTIVVSAGDSQAYLILLSGPVRVRAGDIVVELRNERGDSRVEVLGEVPPFTAIEERVDSLFPGIEEFLQGGSGHLIVRRFPPLVPVPGFFVKNLDLSTGQFGIDHSGWLSDMSDVGRGTRRWASRQQRESFEKGYTYQYAVLEDERTETHVVLFNNLETRASKRIWLQVYDGEGNALLDSVHLIDLPPRAHKRTRIRDIVPPNRLHLPLVGYFETGYDASGMENDRILELHGEVLYCFGAAWEGVQGGAQLWNAPEGFVWPERGKGPRPRAPFPFYAPFIDDEHLETFILLVNNSFSRSYDRSVEFALRVQDRGGKTLGEARRVVSPRQVLFENVRNFLEAETRGLLGVGLVEVRAIDPPNAKCPGQYFYRHRESGRWATEHTRA